LHCDMLGRQLSVGQSVAYPICLGSRLELRVARVESLHPDGSLRVRDHDTSYHAHRRQKLAVVRRLDHVILVEDI
jgi:hypothetical protein